MLLLLVCTAVGTADAQQADSRWQFQLRGGILATGLYRGPMQKPICREGCPVFEQTPLAAPTVLAGIVRRLAPRHSIYLMAGTSRLRFLERGASSPGDTLIPYELEVAFSMLQGQIGHQWQWRRRDKYAFTLSNGLIVERPQKGDNYDYSPQRLNAVNVSYVGKAGMVFWPNQRVSVSADAVFRSALGRYNNPSSDSYADDYHPWGAGLEIGIGYAW